MQESHNRKPSQSAVLLIGILLTVLAVFAHRWLPERRLALDTSKADAVYFLMKFGDDALTKVDWVDQSRRHFKCRFVQQAQDARCSFTFLLYQGNDLAHGVDLSRFRTLNLAMRYTGSAHYLRVAIRNFDPRFSRVEDTNSPKFNLLNLQPKDLVQPVAIDLHEFAVPEWWVSA